MEAPERKGCCIQVVAMLTQTEVDPHDPAFKEPTKFIGPCYPKQEAEKWVHTAPSPPRFNRSQPHFLSG